MLFLRTASNDRSWDAAECRGGPLDFSRLNEDQESSRFTRQKAGISQTPNTSKERRMCTRDHETDERADACTRVTHT